MSKQIVFTLLAVFVVFLASGLYIADDSSATDPVGTIIADDTSVTVVYDDVIGNYTISGNGSVTMTDVNITLSTASAIIITGDVTLNLVGNSTIVTSNGYAGIYVGSISSLTIIGEGTLNVTVSGYSDSSVTYCGAGIGGNYADSERNSGTIAIDNGTIIVTVTGNGACIGGGYYATTTSVYGGNGYVTVNGGTITATANNNGSCIGGGDHGVGYVTVNGGTTTVTAKGNGACIGGGSTGNGHVTVNGGTIIATAEGEGAAIGSGYFDHNDLDYAITSAVTSGYILPDDEVFNGFVSITNGTVKVISGAIGAGTHGNSKVIITGGNITVQNGVIGTIYGTSTKGLHAYAYIDITGGTVSVTVKPWSDGKSLASAIGGGMGTDAYIHIGGNAVITKAVAEISASPVYYQGAAGIGGGYYGRAYIVIDGNANIMEARGSCGAAGIGDGTLTAAYLVTSSLSKVTDKHYTTSYISITDNAKVTAYGGPYAAGIGGGLGNDEITIYIGGNVTINATGGDSYVGDNETVKGGAGIGSGYGSCTNVSGKSAYASQTELTLIIDSTSGSPTINATGGEGAQAIGVGNTNPTLASVNDDITVSIGPNVTINATGSKLDVDDGTQYGPVYGWTEASAIESVTFTYTIDGNTYTYSGSIPAYDAADLTLSIPLEYGVTSSSQMLIEATLKVNATDYQHYVIRGVVGNGSSVTVGYLSVSFETSYKVWFNADNGTVSATVGGSPISSGTIVSNGTEVIFVTSGFNGFELYSINGASSDGSGNYKSTITGDITVTFTYVQSYFTVNFSAENGTVSAFVDGAEISNGATVYRGTNVVFTSVANDKYELSSVTGASKNSAGSYSAVVSGNISVKFVYTLVSVYYDIIMPVGGSELTFIPLDDMEVLAGNSFSFQVNVNEGFEDQIYYIFVNGVRVLSENGVYTVEGIEENIHITAEFPIAMAANVESVENYDFLLCFELLAILTTIFVILGYIRDRKDEEIEL